MGHSHIQIQKAGPNKSSYSSSTSAGFVAMCTEWQKESSYTTVKFEQRLNFVQNLFDAVQLHLRKSQSDQRHHKVNQTVYFKIQQKLIGTISSSLKENSAVGMFCCLTTAISCYDTTPAVSDARDTSTRECSCTRTKTAARISTFTIAPVSSAHLTVSAVRCSAQIASCSATV